MTIHKMFEICYPEKRFVSSEWVISQAKDYLATAYMKYNPHADEAAIEENSRIFNVMDAIDLLQDAGIVTFTTYNLE